MDLSSSHRAPGAPPSADALAALLDCEADLEALERALLAAAVHPEGGGCTRAWLLRWDARRGLLEGWARAARAAEPGALAAAIARARRAAPVDDPEGGSVRAWAEAPDRLD
ncbi:MAG TPA: hypothetical protein VGU27_12165, partial [Candidatus Eisenbacteria bacterium]|nr:hypothetical protein [Candidatus Eisenbacteria bacterium]